MIWGMEKSMAGQTGQEPGCCLPAQGSPLPEHRRHRGQALSAPRGYWPPLLCPGQGQSRFYKAESDRPAGSLVLTTEP